MLNNSLISVFKQVRQVTLSQKRV